MWKYLGQHAVTGFGAGAGKSAVDHTVKHVFGLANRWRRRAPKGHRAGRGGPPASTFRQYTTVLDNLAKRGNRKLVVSRAWKDTVGLVVYRPSGRLRGFSIGQTKRGNGYSGGLGPFASTYEAAMSIWHMEQSKVRGLGNRRGRPARLPKVRSSQWKKSKNFWDDRTYTVTITGTDGHKPGLTTITARKVSYYGGFWQQELRRGTLKLGRNKKAAETFLLWYRGAKAADKKLWGGSGYLGDASEAFGWNYYDNRPEGGWDRS